MLATRLVPYGTKSLVFFDLCAFEYRYQGDRINEAGTTLMTWLYFLGPLTKTFGRSWLFGINLDALWAMIFLGKFGRQLKDLLFLCEDQEKKDNRTTPP